MYFSVSCFDSAHPASRRELGYMFCSCFIFNYRPISDFCRTDYLNIHRTDLYDICRAVDEWSAVIIPWRPIVFAQSNGATVLDRPAVRLPTVCRRVRRCRLSLRPHSSVLGRSTFSVVHVPHQTRSSGTQLHSLLLRHTYGDSDVISFHIYTSWFSAPYCR